MPRARLSPVALCSSVILLAVVGYLIYIPGLHGPFLFDDLSNFLQVPAVAIDAPDTHQLLGVIVSDDGSVLRRPLPRISFALSYYFAGQAFDEFAFKAFNLFVHLSNTLLVFVLTLHLYRQRARRANNPGGGQYDVLFSLLVAGLWLVHPVQLTSVLYVVQRMTSLAASFVFLGLYLFGVGRSRLQSATSGAWWLMVTGLLVGTLMGVLCKETAVVTPLLAALLSRCFWDADRLAGADRRRLKQFWVGLGSVGLLAVAYLLIRHLDWLLSLYNIRDFTPWERLLTQARVLVFYVGLILVPNVRKFGLFHDDFAVSTGLLNPPTTIVCVLGLVLAGVAAVWGLRDRRMWAFAVLWFLVGHIVESTVIGLELVHEHRNYVPSFALFFCLVHYLLRGAAASGQLRMGVFVAVSITVVVAFGTLTRATAWESRLSLAQQLAKNHPGSYRSREALAFAYVESGRPVQEVYEAFRGAAAMNPRAVIPLVEMLRIVRTLMQGDLALPVGDRRLVDDVLRDSLRLETTWLEAAPAGIEIEVSRRLADYPIETGTELALYNLLYCAYLGDPVCRSMSSTTLRWHVVALDNDRATSVQRETLIQSMETFRTMSGERGASVKAGES